MSIEAGKQQAGAAAGPRVRELDAGALRRLMRPIGLIQGRLRAMADQGWDVNALHLIALHLRELADHAREQQIVDLGNRLHRLHRGLGRILEVGTAPATDQVAALLDHVAALNDYAPGAGGLQPERAGTNDRRRIRAPQLPAPELDLAGLPDLSNIPHFIVPPDGFLPAGDPALEGRGARLTPAASGEQQQPLDVAPTDHPATPDGARDVSTSRDGATARSIEPLVATDAVQGVDPWSLDAAVGVGDFDPVDGAAGDLRALFDELEAFDGESPGAADPEPGNPPAPGEDRETAESPARAAGAASPTGDDELDDLFADIEDTVSEAGADSESTQAPERTQFAPAAVKANPAPAARGDQPRSLYVLHGGDGTTAELVAALEPHFEVQSFTDPEEFLEILGAIGPDGVIVDDAHLNRIDEIAPIIRKLRMKIHGPLSLIVFSARQDVQSRLHLMRAGADVFLSTELEIALATERIREELDSSPEDPYRILIVEDDRSQALFAQSILKRSGMSARIETDPLAVMGAMETFEPDLVLMDLHMPDCDGMELTAMIRERDAFIHMPIVFLSGEDDEDIQFDALLAGGDDFLTKPIRPRHLISAVKNRVRRARSIPAPAAEPAADSAPPARTGMVERSRLVAGLGEALESLSRGDDAPAGGVLYAEVDRVYALRRRHGLTVLEELAAQLEPMLEAALTDGASVARYGDAAWCFHFPAADLAALEHTAQELVKAVASQPMTLAGETTRVTLSAGLCQLSPKFEHAALLVAAAERSCNRDADEDYGRIGIHRQLSSTADAGLRELGEVILEALDNDGFQMVYQPIVSLQGQEVDQYQCLLRLPREGQEALAPARVLTAAGELGMVDQIDRWVLKSAIGVLTEHAGRARPLQLFVNQSGVADGDGDLAAWLLRNLRERHVPGSSLILEFKLHELAQALKSVVALARELTPRRIRFCLGHFDGSETGFRILEYYRAEFVKIRPEVAFRQLRDGLLTDTVQRLHEAGAQVIVPGVEEAQLAVQLWSAGVDFIQGHFVQKPESDLSYSFDGSAT